MNNQDTLFPIIKDDITFDTLLAQAKAVIEQQSGQCWNNTGENDPGITLLEACCYGTSDLAYRHSLPLQDLLTPKNEEQTLNDGIFPEEFGPQQILTCGPITAEDYRRALLDLHGDNTINGYFFFNDAQLIREPESERYEYWYNKEKREYSFTKTSNSEQLTLRGNYWLYLTPSRETETDKTQAQESLENFLRDNRNLGELVSKIIWLEPIDLLLKIEIQLDDDAKDIADIVAKVYMTVEQMVLEKPLRYTTQDMIEKGYSNEQIFEGPYLRHGWIPELPQTKDYTRPTVLNLSPLVNQLLAIKGVKNITKFTLDDSNVKISKLSNDNWSWEIRLGYYPRLWKEDSLDLITSEESPLTITAKNGIKVVVTKEQIADKIITEPLIHTKSELLKWGKHRKVQNYHPVSNKLPACYGFQINSDPPQQAKLHQFMLPFEQMLANGCAELALLPKLLAFKQRENIVHGAQLPFKTNTVGQKIHQDIESNLKEKLDSDSQIENKGDNHNYKKELTILDYLLRYFGVQQTAMPIIPNLKAENYKNFIFTQREYLAQQPDLAYHRNNIRIDKVSALQKRIAARLGLGEECFKKNPELNKLPFYLIEHRQLLPVKPNTIFNTGQKPDSLQVRGDQLWITRKDTIGQLLPGQMIDLIVEGDRGFTLWNQIITEVTEETFCLNTANSTALKLDLERVKQAVTDQNLLWRNSSVWMNDMDYQLTYDDKEHQDNERWIISNPQTPFPTMIKEKDEITLKYAITPDGALESSKETPNPTKPFTAQVVEFDRIEGRILLRLNENGDSQTSFPSEANAKFYRWYFSSEKYAKTDRFSFAVSVVINRQLIKNGSFDPYKLESWVKTEILAEFPAHISIIIHWLSQDHFEDFACSYKRWQNNRASLGQEAYRILETLTLGKRPSIETGIGRMRIATEEQRIKVIGNHEDEWNGKVIEDNQLLYVPKIFSQH
ncbi:MULTISPECIES: hypothetical protein [Photorhabdus]|uniref:Uncharacterized protein n=1 Tax=Photorhabdus thracensis TaxID=230089 RepID=A0A0F7LRC9_9GAMM|nr:hypothetical protein [Photorhabdus thracensis]AKH65170.1 hypothetical protein VY86_19250 [Photorhabdus thracensis]